MTKFMRIFLMLLITMHSAISGCAAEKDSKKNTRTWREKMIYQKESVSLWWHYGKDLNKRNKHEMLPLRIAILNDSGAHVKTLIEHKADVFADEGLLDWSILSKTDALEKTTLLLEQGVFSLTHRREAAPLHQAIGGGAAALVKILLDYGAYPNERNDYLGYPLYVAKGIPDKSVACLLVSYGAVPSEDDYYKRFEQPLYDELLKDRKNYRESLKEILTPHFPVFQEKSGAPLVELTLEYAQGSLADEVMINKKKARENIERLNKTLPADRQRKIPEHLLQEFTEQKTE
jgi:hypothetical protein